MRTLPQRLRRLRKLFAEGRAGYDEAVEMAKVNARTMTEEAARAWAMDFLQDHPDAHEFVWSFVGEVRAHQESPRGPPPACKAPIVDRAYDRVVAAAAKQLDMGSRRLSADERTEMLERVNAICGTYMLPPLSKQELAAVLRRVLPA